MDTRLKIYNISIRFELIQKHKLSIECVVKIMYITYCIIIKSTEIRYVPM